MTARASLCLLCGEPKNGSFIAPAQFHCILPSHERQDYILLMVYVYTLFETIITVRESVGAAVKHTNLSFRRI